MRTKEVDKAIERLKNGKNIVCFGRNTAIFFIKDVETVLNYIEKLEYKIQENETKEYFKRKDSLMG